MKFLALPLMLIAMACHADSELRLAFSPDQLSGATELGAVQVEGVGSVRLIAQKNGAQLVIHAESPDGSVIGKAETVVGLKDTPIYVKAENGLKKITIHWGAN